MTEEPRPEQKGDVAERLAHLRAEYTAELPPIEDDQLEEPSEGQAVRLITVPRWAYGVLLAVLSVSVVLLVLFAGPQIGLFSADRGVFQALATPLPTPLPPTPFPTATPPQVAPPANVELPPPPLPTYPPDPPTPTPLPTPEPEPEVMHVMGPDYF
jgi:hypothetical protein